MNEPSAIHVAYIRRNIFGNLAKMTDMIESTFWLNKNWAIERHFSPFSRTWTKENIGGKMETLALRHLDWEKSHLSRSARLVSSFSFIQAKKDGGHWRGQRGKVTGIRPWELLRNKVEPIEMRWESWRESEREISPSHDEAVSRLAKYFLPRNPMSAHLEYYRSAIHVRNTRMGTKKRRHLLAFSLRYCNRPVLPNVWIYYYRHMYMYIFIYIMTYIFIYINVSECGTRGFRKMNHHVENHAKQISRSRGNDECVCQKCSPFEVGLAPTETNRLATAAELQNQEVSLRIIRSTYAQNTSVFSFIMFAIKLCIISFIIYFSQNEIKFDRVNLNIYLPGWWGLFGSLWWFRLQRWVCTDFQNVFATGSVYSFSRGLRILIPQ